MIVFIVLCSVTWGGGAAMWVTADDWRDVATSGAVMLVALVLILAGVKFS